MRVITNAELLAISGGTTVEGGTTDTSWWDSFTSWVGNFFTGGGGSSGGSSTPTGGTSEVQTVVIDGGTRYSNMSSAEQAALNLAIERELLQKYNPGCTVSVGTTIHGGTFTITLTGSASPGIAVGGSQQGPSTTRTTTCAP